MSDLLRTALYRPFVGNLSLEHLRKSASEGEGTLCGRVLTQGHMKGCSFSVMNRVRLKARRFFCGKRAADSNTPEQDRREYADLSRRFDRLVKGEVSIGRNVFLTLGNNAAHGVEIMNDFVRGDSVPITPVRHVCDMQDEERSNLTKATGNLIMDAIAREMNRYVKKGDEPRKTVLIIPLFVKDPDGERHVASFTIDWTVTDEKRHPVWDYFDPKGNEGRDPMRATLSVSLEGTEHELPVGDLLAYMETAMDAECGPFSEALHREMADRKKNYDEFGDSEGRETLIRMGEAIDSGTLKIGGDICCDEFRSLTEFAQQREGVLPSPLSDRIHERAQAASVTRGAEEAGEFDARTLSEQLSPCIADIDMLENEPPSEGRADALIKQRVAVSYLGKREDMACLRALEKEHRTVLELKHIRESLDEAQGECARIEETKKELHGHMQHDLEIRAKTMSREIQRLGEEYERADILTRLEEDFSIPEGVQEIETREILVNTKERMAQAILVNTKERMAFATLALRDARIACNNTVLELRKVEGMLQRREKESTGLDEGYLQEELGKAEDKLSTMRSHFGSVIKSVESGALVPCIEEWECNRKEDFRIRCDAAETAYRDYCEGVARGERQEDEAEEQRLSEAVRRARAEQETDGVESRHLRSIEEIDKVKNWIQYDASGVLSRLIERKFVEHDIHNRSLFLPGENAQSIEDAFLAPYLEEVRYYRRRLADPERKQRKARVDGQVRRLQGDIKTLTAKCERYADAKGKYVHALDQLCGSVHYTRVGLRGKGLYASEEWNKVSGQLTDVKEKMAKYEKRLAKKRSTLARLRKKEEAWETIRDGLEGQADELKGTILDKKREIAGKLARQEMRDHLNGGAVDAVYSSRSASAWGETGTLQEAIRPRRKRFGRSITDVAGAEMFHDTPLETIARGQAWSVSEEKEAEAMKSRAAETLMEVLGRTVPVAREAKTQHDKDKSIANAANPFVKWRRNFHPVLSKRHTSSETRLSSAKPTGSAGSDEYNGVSYLYIVERRKGYDHETALKRVEDRIAGERTKGKRRKGRRRDALRAEVARESLHTPSPETVRGALRSVPR
ncbi:MAG: hypothetical protein OXF02_04675 [Simkaniaceae bacterium]|nr:hypothetical protein [Simkaniaceae bacterium]